MTRHWFEASRAMRWGLVAAAIGGAAFVVGMLLERQQTMFSYLTAYSFVAGTVLGALLLLGLFHAMNAGWPTVVRRLLEGSAATIPLLVVLFVPIALQLPALFPWVHAEQLSDPHVRQVVTKKLAYLNVPFFLVRTGIYLAVATAFAEALLRAPRARMRWLGAAALPLVGWCANFAGVDWVMTLAPAWYSSLFGLYFIAGGCVAAMALLVLFAVVERERLALGPSHFYALGRALLALVLLWAYFAYYQLMLIWEANKPDEARWYVDRWQPGWRWMSVTFIIVGHFAVPALLLLSYRLKHEPRLLGIVAFWLLLVHYFDLFWCIAPALHVERFHFTWTDALLCVGMAGGLVAFGAARLRGQSLAPYDDPAYPRALEYQSR